MSLRNKNILVVGGSRGIGQAVVDLLADGGANVYIVSRTPPVVLPANAMHLAADVGTLLETLPAFLPEHLHGLVYSVGSITLKPFNRLTEHDFLNDYQLNVLGAARAVQHALKPLKAAGGASVVLVSSVAARAGMPYHASIAAAKSAVEGLGLSLAAELASQSIRVNIVAPSLTDTPMAQHLLNTPEKREAAARRHPLGKFGQPEDIARTITFLLSPDSSWMTGQVIGVDGGLSSLRTT